MAKLTFLLLPTYLIRIPLGDSMSLPLLDLLLIITILINLPHLKKRQSLRYIKKNSWLSLCVGLISAGFTVSYLVNVDSKNWTDGLGILKSFLILPIIFGLVLKSKGGYINPPLRMIFVLTSFLSVLGYFYSLFGILTYDGRLKLFFESPNQLAMLLTIGFLAGVSLFKPARSTRPSWFLLIVFLLAHLFALYQTHSLGAWVGLFGSLGFWFWHCRGGKYSAPTVMGFVVLLSLSLLFLPLFNHQPKSPFSSLDSRVAIYEATRKIIKDNWLWGIGPGNFQSTYLEYQKYFPPYPQWAVPHTHNNLLHFWAEGGILALLGSIGLLILLVKQKTRPINPVLITILIYLLFHGIVDVTIWKNDLAIIFWWLIFTILFDKSRRLYDR